MSWRHPGVFWGHQGISTTTMQHQQGGRTPTGNDSVVNSLHLWAFRLAALATGALTWWWGCHRLPQSARYHRELFCREFDLLQRVDRFPYPGDLPHVLATTFKKAVVMCSSSHQGLRFDELLCHRDTHAAGVSGGWVDGTLQHHQQATTGGLLIGFHLRRSLEIYVDPKYILRHRPFYDSPDRSS